PITLSNASDSYGCEFSPDGTKFYGRRTTSANNLIQWDLTAGSNMAIISSTVLLNNSSSIYGVSGMQLAPNGKIYIASYNSPTISVINNPNALGTSCNFVYGGTFVQATVNVGGSNFISSSAYGLPNMQTSYIS